MNVPGPEGADPLGVNPVGVGRSCGRCYPQVKTCGYSRKAPAGAIPKRLNLTPMPTGPHRTLCQISVAHVAGGAGQDSKFKIQDSKFKIATQYSKFKTQDSRFEDSEFPIQVKIQNSRFKIRVQHSKLKMKRSGLQGRDSKFQIQNSRRRAPASDFQFQVSNYYASHGFVRGVAEGGQGTLRAEGVARQADFSAEPDHLMAEGNPAVLRDQLY